MKFKGFYFLVASFLFMSCKECVDIEVPYSEEVPYEATEEYEGELTYEAGNVQWSRVSGSTIFNVKPYIESYMHLTNTGEKGGVFKVVQVFKSSYGDEINLEEAQYIRPGSTVRFDFKRDLDFYVQAIYDRSFVYAPTVKLEKKVTKYKTVTRFRKCNTCVEGCN